jgi:hypothetical protein
MQFISEKEENAIISKNLSKAFEDAEEMEKRLGKDMCEWTSGEIIDYYKYLSTPYVQTLIQLHNSLTNYATWCILNGLVKNNQNHYLEIKTEMILNCTDINSLIKTVISREELLKEIKTLPNESDKFIMLGLFEGIPVADDVMKNVKLSDLEDNILHLSNGVDLKISEQLKNYMYLADQEDCYVSYSNLRSPQEIPYKDDGCIIRETIRNQSDKTNSTIFIGARLRRVIKYLGMAEGTTMKTIMESGRLHFIKELAKEYNVKMEDTINNRKLRDIHERIFGKIQNRITYMSTYGRCFEDITEDV